jgi:UDP-N-acetylmuramoylalanine--D-glutamate ligase
MELKGKKVLVVGLARTGIAAARFLAEKGARVKISEAKGATELSAALAALQDLSLEKELGGHTLPFFLESDLIIVSPGVPMDLNPLTAARDKGIPILSEVELAFRFLRRPLIGITGTNGKTTTTTLIGEFLRASGRSAFVGGNIGNPLIGYVASGQKEEWAVAEISSFQLEWIEFFRPHVSVLLNLTEDHLDRYPNFAEYCWAKGRIFENQKKEDYAVLSADDPLVLPYAKRVLPRVFFFSREKAVSRGCFLDGQRIIYLGEDGKKESFDVSRLQIRGAHNLENLMAAIAVGRICGCSREAIQKVMESFRGLEHRLELVREWNGVKFFNDSKGTNVGSVVKSLISFEEPVWLIAGGKDKGGDYGPLRELIQERVKGMALIGEAKDRISAALGMLTETVKFGSLEEAVHWAAAKAAPGDIVLLSPACSSYDMFANYQERGKRFKAIVQGITGGGTPTESGGEEGHGQSR